MSLAHISNPVRSIGWDWIWVMTSSLLAVALAWYGLLGYTSTHHWVSWLILIFTLCWAFVRSWNREHAKILLLVREFVLPEVKAVRHEASASTRVEFNSNDAEVDFYFERLRPASRGIDKGLLKEILDMCKKCQPIVSKL